jgi:hypothetical protein
MPTIWAASTAAPGNTCADARLLGDGRMLSYPAGNFSGQAGWDIGVGFTTFTDLANNLKKITDAKGKCSRLAINLHGNTGIIDADGKGSDGEMKDMPAPEADGYPPTRNMYNMKKLREKYSKELKIVNDCLTVDAPVIFMGCLVARDAPGERFLKEMSAEFFKGHKVVGFKTIGVTGRGQFRAGEFCTNPGMRDTPWTTESSRWSEKQKVERESLLADPASFVSIPWAKEDSPNAKFALDGEMKGGADPVVATSTNPADFLLGRFSAEAGAWKGFFTFERSGKCYWQEAAGGALHPGKWAIKGSAAEWTFDDDQKGWERLIRLPLPPRKNEARGSYSADVTIKGVSHGWFEMWKQ